LLKAALFNGLLWMSILLITTYIFKGGLFLFFAGTGALRKYYQLNKKD